MAHIPTQHPPTAWCWQTLGETSGAPALTEPGWPSASAARAAHQACALCSLKGDTGGHGWLLRPARADLPCAERGSCLVLRMSASAAQVSSVCFPPHSSPFPRRSLGTTFFCSRIKDNCACFCLSSTNFSRTCPQRPLLHLFVQRVPLDGSVLVAQPHKAQRNLFQVQQGPQHHHLHRGSVQQARGRA